MWGLSVPGVVLLPPAFSGALAATAGLRAFPADHTASPSLGSDWLLASFVAPAIGGTLLSGGPLAVAGIIAAGPPRAAHPHPPPPGGDEQLPVPCFVRVGRPIPLSLLTTSPPP